ncbi:MAG TPA: diaminopimelate decarboxylase [Myxococcota bacterium]|nr:diaminopimelate decarboxylase [Myxococcota bacterium]
MSDASPRTLSDAFPRRDGHLCADAVPIDRIVDAVGTPVFIYSATELAARYDALDAAFAGVPHSICYAIKANMNLAVVRTLVARGCGVDVTSGGELRRALAAGADPRGFVYSGVGKTDAEIDLALSAGIRVFNVESRAELRAIAARAAASGAVAPISFRVNPDVDPQTHPYISTGLRSSKFGIPIAEAVDAYAEAKALDAVRVVGVACHIGSQLVSLDPIRDALRRVRGLVRELREAGHRIEILDVGGGLGIRYDREQPPSAAEYAAAVIDALGDLGCHLISEPGRWIAGDAGVFVTRVLYHKCNGAKQFAVVDGAMTDLIRPTLYQAYQKIEPVGPPRAGSRVVDVVGPVCESGDFLAQQRELPPLERGDLLAVRSAGAYGFSMSSNYNGRCRAAEVLVRGERFAVVRERERFEDLIRGESLAEELLG